MNIVEAIKSGKPFKRVNKQIWRKLEDISDTCCKMMAMEDLIANDWEIQEEARACQIDDFEGLKMRKDQWNDVAKYARCIKKGEAKFMIPDYAEDILKKHVD